jgi:replicative DNA helicase
MEKQIVDNLKRFGAEFQTKCVASLLSDKAFLERILDILLPEYFESDSNKWIVGEITSYFLQYKDIPTLTVFKVRSDTIEQADFKMMVINQLKNVYQKISDTDINYVKETFLEFCKNQSLKNAMLIGVEYLKTGEYEKIRTEIDKALKAGAERNLGHDYYADVDKRLSDIARFCVKTGWSLVDTLLDGGLASGELGVVISSAGGGKSWCLARLGAEAMLSGKNVIHYTLELNENYVGRRYDACFTGFDFQAIPKQKDSVKKRVDEMKNEGGVGKLKVKYFPIKTVSAMSLKSHLERCQMIDGIRYDMMVVDYADILRPITAEKNSNSYAEAGSIYEELRMIAGELQIPIWTASQGNRSSSEEDIITAKSVADSYRKIMTADFVMSLSRKMEDKVSNTARFHIIKNRFGCDGITFPSIFNSSNGSITMYEASSKEGIDLQVKMDESDSNANKSDLDMIKDKWQQHRRKDEDNSESDNV